MIFLVVKNNSPPSPCTYPSKVCASPQNSKLTLLKNYTK